MLEVASIHEVTRLSHLAAPFHRSPLGLENRLAAGSEMQGKGHTAPMNKLLGKSQAIGKKYILADLWTRSKALAH
jgi:hypothetical protein